MKTPGSSPLTAADVFQSGHWFARGGEQYEIIAWDSKKPLDVEARCASTGAICHFVLLELFSSPPETHFAATRRELEKELGSSGSGEVAGDADAKTLPEALLQRVDHLIETVEAVKAQMEQIQRQHQLAGKPFSASEVTRQACQAIPMPVSLSGYYAYRRLYRACSGDRARLAAALRRKTFGKTPMEANAQYFVDKVLDNVRLAQVY